MYCKSLFALDDDEETAEGEKEGNEIEDEELDPLDAYMEEVKEEVKKFNMRSVKGGGGSEKVYLFFITIKTFPACICCHLLTEYKARLEKEF